MPSKNPSEASPISIFFHGTTSSRAKVITENGFEGPVFFTPDFEHATEYAMIGGEESLQQREEAFFRDNGEWPRELYDTDEMWFKLYPENETPVVIEVHLSKELLLKGVPDPHGGPKGNLMFIDGVAANAITEIHAINMPTKVERAKLGW
jgi:hypothetical protein